MLTYWHGQELPQFTALGGTALLWQWQSGVEVGGMRSMRWAGAFNLWHRSSS